MADYVQRQTHASFQAAWEALGGANELQVRHRGEGGIGVFIHIYFYFCTEGEVVDIGYKCIE